MPEFSVLDSSLRPCMKLSSRESKKIIKQKKNQEVIIINSIICNRIPKDQSLERIQIFGRLRRKLEEKRGIL